MILRLLVDHHLLRLTGDNWAEVYSADQTDELRFVIYGHDAGRDDDGVQEFGLTRGLETRFVFDLQLNQSYTQVFYFRINKSTS